MDAIHALSCVDKRYLQHLEVLIISLFENKTCPNAVIYHILYDNDLNDADKKPFTDIEKKYHATVVFHDVGRLSQKYEHVVRYGHVSRAGLYRISIPEIFSSDITKVLYLDCDIVINGDIFDLWNTDISNYAVAAVEDAVSFSRHQALMMPEKSLYFNSGVLLINLEKWALLNATDKILKFMIDFPERRAYNDQDGLNAFLHDSWLRLPPKYNQQSALYYLPCKRLVYSGKEYAEAIRHPVIIHYIGVIKDTKPWHYIDIHPLKKYYYKYLKLTSCHTYTVRPKNVKEVVIKIYLWLFRYKMKTGIVFGKILKLSGGKN
ncbi:MAG: glycosyltransferase family 8 protein [Dysgonamonadaceae bacterium]|jgi:lipopolysaccharide biosynthesis glycosyltransferase|nr:glycosyltransferase family 8 protein [Dysgonamonadaceae bacterium]